MRESAKVRDKPFIIRIRREPVQGRYVTRGYAFVPGMFKQLLASGKIPLHRIQAVMSVGWEPRGKEIAPKVQINMMMQSWVHIKEDSTRVQWEVLEGKEGISDEKKRQGVIEHDLRWVGLQVELDNDFSLRWYSPRSRDYSRRHLFSYREDALRIQVASGFDVIPRSNQLFRINPVLRHIMQWLEGFSEG